MFARFIRPVLVNLLIVFAGSAQADEAFKPAISETIQNQITAFQNDDFAQAFSFASPAIKRLFGTSENFGMMVQRGYPMVHRSTDVRFLQLRTEQGALVQRVQVFDATGRSHLLDYAMIRLENGWKINGVRLLKDAGVAA